MESCIYLESSTFRFAPTEWATNTTRIWANVCRRLRWMCCEVGWSEFDRPIFSFFFLLFERFSSWWNLFWTTCEKWAKGTKKKVLIFLVHFSFILGCCVVRMPHTLSHARHTNNQSIKIVSVTYNAAFIIWFFWVEWDSHAVPRHARSLFQ